MFPINDQQQTEAYGGIYIHNKEEEIEISPVHFYGSKDIDR
jgi:hypothetical protein